MKKGKIALWAIIAIVVIVLINGLTSSSSDTTSDDAKGYQEIYDEYSARLTAECPTLSMTECAELSNEGVSEMATYMYSASGTEGQYETYERWAGDLMDVYLTVVR